MEFQKELLYEKGKFILEQAEKVGADQAEASIVLREFALTRLANSIIDQNVAEKHASVNIILYFGKRKGSTNVEVFENNALIKVIESVARIAKLSPEDADFKSIPSPMEYSSQLKDIELVSKSTLDADPEKRAEYAMTAIDIAHDTDKRISSVAGAISNATTEKVFFNSLGIEAYRAGTTSEINLTILASDGVEETAGWSSDTRRDFNQLKVEDVARIAATKATTGFGMVNIEPGEYEIVLEPAALSGFMFFINYFGFSAQNYQDYQSFLIDKIGEKVFSEKLSLWDDALDNRFASPTSFDAEGYPKSKLDLVEKGVVKNLVYDSKTATKDGVASTGHNARFWGRSLPFATHLLVAEGDSDIEEMIAETKKGILVTHFHYQNAVNPVKGIFTGLTRDGTWYIENGEIKAPLRTLRYTDAAPRFLSDIDLVGKYSEIRDGGAIVPPMKLPSFRISGSSEQ
ncbi:MAG: TldD/PmbA family protein [Candidatus Thorarchaeota archaeon]